MPLISNNKYKAANTNLVNLTKNIELIISYYNSIYTNYVYVNIKNSFLVKVTVKILKISTISL